MIPADLIPFARLLAVIAALVRFALVLDRRWSR